MQSNWLSVSSPPESVASVQLRSKAGGDATLRARQEIVLKTQSTLVRKLCRADCSKIDSDGSSSRSHANTPWHTRTLAETLSLSLPSSFSLSPLPVNTAADILTCPWTGAAPALRCIDETTEPSSDHDSKPSERLKLDGRSKALNGRKEQTCLLERNEK